eukprot:COSAG03_NODE_1245_length_4483_cov_1.831661_4_plen_479_part_00
MSFAISTRPTHRHTADRPLGIAARRNYRTEAIPHASSATMELRPRHGRLGGLYGGPRRAQQKEKDMRLRIFLASIGLTVYAARLEQQGMTIEAMAETDKKALQAMLGGTASEEELREIASAARDYAARQRAGADPQKQLELDMLWAEEGVEEVVDLQAEIDALKSDGLFGGGSPDKDSQTEEDDEEEETSEEDGGAGSSEEEPVKKPQPAKKQQQKQANKEAEVKQPAQKGKGGGKGKGAKGGAGKGPEAKDKNQPKQPSAPPESRRQTKRKKKVDDKSKKLDAGSPDVLSTPYSEKLRTLFRRERIIPTLQATRTIVSMLFTFYCANWVIAACARWVEYSTGRSMQLSTDLGNWFLKNLLMFAMPRPPLYPIPLYLCCNALVDVLEMWANQSGRFADGSPISVKMIGISLYACDIGAVLYGGCFLLTGISHCLALATGKSFEEYLVRSCSHLPLRACPVLVPAPHPRTPSEGSAGCL